MTLYEMGLEYKKSAEPIRARLKLLRSELKSANSYDERLRIKRRIAVLTPMLRDCNRLAEFCTCYYDKGFYIGDGALDARRERVRQGATKQLSTQGVAVHIDKRTFTKAGAGRGGMFVERSDISELSRRARRKQNDCLQKLLCGSEKTC